MACSCNKNKVISDVLKISDYNPKSIRVHPGDTIPLSVKVTVDSWIPINTVFYNINVCVKDAETLQLQGSKTIALMEPVIYNTKIVDIPFRFLANKNKTYLITLEDSRILQLGYACDDAKELTVEYVPVGEPIKEDPIKKYGIYVIIVFFFFMMMMAIRR